MKPEHVIARIQKDAPLWLASSWDHSGIQVRGNRQCINRMAVALDPTAATIGKALDQGADFILTHHPLGLTPRFPAANDELYATMSLLMSQGVWLYAAHTTLDAQPEGPSRWLARELGMINEAVLEPTAKKTALLVRIPHGRDLCPIACPEALTVMEQGDLVELVVWKDQWPRTRQQLESSHGSFDYHALTLEEPAQVYGFGCIGDLQEPVGWPDLQARLARLLGTACWTHIGAAPEAISRVAYCPGSGASLATRAFGAGAHVYITGDIKYHQALDTQHLGLTLDVGHHVLEENMMRVWHETMQQDFAAQGVELVFIPSRDPLRIQCA
ncbi:Nif3-like dinuclear metal center hexameric protein [Desulfoplanes formicivorans]|uniref:GTP cyclohydrolase 1 type 2 homolog n=1 Tax=Desulfoplanes formicivorans TaxID=1592317 RepID=A0A194AJX6_9BACT|nr:Nif3-like dinuclear metal center hexameric protein [Desulfoplanes formicivorans]GAU09545.1 hypothetical protein DPF_2273 [Desulfoplanes formicivorans]